MYHLKTPPLPPPFLRNKKVFLVLGKAWWCQNFSSLPHNNNKKNRFGRRNRPLFFLTVITLSPRDNMTAFLGGGLDAVELRCSLVTFSPLVEREFCTDCLMMPDQVYLSVLTAQQ